jgi:hypothetical protein
MKSNENENPTWRPNKIRQVRHLVTQFSKWQKLKYLILKVDISNGARQCNSNGGDRHSACFLRLHH